MVPDGDRRVVGRDGYDPEVRDNLAAGVDEVLTLAQDMGGIMEYCHGVGIKLHHLLGRELESAGMRCWISSERWIRRAS